MANITVTEWQDKNGIKISINKMTSSHLLNTIHMIERKRYEEILSLVIREEANAETMGYYAQFPDAYHALCDEAERRKLIQRRKMNESKNSLSRI